MRIIVSFSRSVVQLLLSSYFTVFFQLYDEISNDYFYHKIFHRKQSFRRKRKKSLNIWPVSSQTMSIRRARTYNVQVSIWQICERDDLANDNWLLKKEKKKEEIKGVNLRVSGIRNYNVLLLKCFAYEVRRSKWEGHQSRTNKIKRKITRSLVGLTG